VLFRRLRKRRQGPPTREARLRPEYAWQYPRIKPDLWLPIRTILRRHRQYWAGGTRRLPPEAFEFRGGMQRNPGWPLLRQRATDEPPEVARSRGPRQALLRPEARWLHPEVRHGEWQDAREVEEIVLERLQREQGASRWNPDAPPPSAGQRALSDDHFIFRWGALGEDVPRLRTRRSD